MVDLLDCQLVHLKVLKLDCRLAFWRALELGLL